MRIRQLDILRALAILLVLGRHPVVKPDDAGIFFAPAALWHRFGWTGVDLFFVLSGFLIGGLLFAELKRESSLNVRRFLIRRGFKIWPAYGVLVMFMVATASLTHRDGTPYTIWERLAAYAPHFFHAQNYFGQITLHTWSLAVEEHFYLLLPLLLIALSRWTKGSADRLFKAVTCATVVVLVSCVTLRALQIPRGSEAVWGHMAWTHLRADSLFFGVFLAAFCHLHPAWLAWLQHRRVPLLVVGLLLVSPMVFIPVETSSFVWIFGITFLYVGYGCVLIAAISFEIGASQTVRALTFVGIASYGIYLWHWHIGHVLAVIAARPSGLLPHSLHWAIFTSAYVFSTIAFGHLMTKVIELPMLRHRDRWFPRSAVNQSSPWSLPASPHSTHQDSSTLRSTFPVQVES